MGKISEHCENCYFWRKRADQTARPFWGLCTATEGLTFRRYISPVPDTLETVGPFYCAAFQPSLEAVRRVASEEMNQQRGD